MRYFLTLVVVLIIGICVYAYSAFDASASARADSPTATVAAQPSVQTVNGETVVVVSPDAQRASHIEVSPLATSRVEHTRSAYATVVDLQPLFDLRNRLASARADAESLATQASNAQAQYARSRALFDDDRNMSRKSLQDAQTAMQGDDARARSAHSIQEGLDAMLRQQFGDTLANAASATASDLFERLLMGRASIVRVTLPAGAAGEAGESGEAPPKVTVDAPDGQRIAMQWLSASPTADPAVQGQAWLYTTARALPVGMRTTAHLPTTQEPATSLVIPARAVLWYGGQTWVYMKTANDRFTRRFVSASTDDDQDVAVTTGFHAGDEVVTQGAQLLLSEELKPQGIATVCKDPPECDD
nr:efflux RND transporter periplasmic adaptor subunit [Paraburkholderia sp. ZP32-5]